MSSLDPIDRTIVPHALAHDGFCWHARALCLRDQTFKDFAIDRILRSLVKDASDIDPQADLDWQETITLKIAPHPGLSDNQRKILELDYAMSDGLAELQVRKCLLFYNLKRLGLDVNTELRFSNDQQMVPINRESLSISNE